MHLTHIKTQHTLNEVYRNKILFYNININLFFTEGVCHIKITIDESGDANEIEIYIKCPKITEEIEAAVAQLRLLGKQKTVTGLYNGEIYFLDYRDVIYFDTTDRKTFIYTTERVYETALKLYQLEDMLKDTSFIRVSKSMILNIRKINSIGHTFSGKMIATLVNGEKAEISRNYVPLLKEKLGI